MIAIFHVITKVGMPLGRKCGGSWEDRCRIRESQFNVITKVGLLLGRKCGWKLGRSLLDSRKSTPQSLGEERKGG